MKRALQLARLGLGKTSPNPAVGAVLVKNGKIIGEGYHKKAGSPHAEIIAIKNAGSKVKGSTLYMNLEPCDHFGRTPPCTNAIINSKIKKVISSMIDPNPVVAGKGIKKLKKHRIEVQVGLLKKEAEKLNEAYIKHIKTGYPFVSVKMAMSLDGKIATKTGESKWITGKSARNFVHNKLRAQVDAVLVGINTVLKDNPALNAKLRIILDSRLRIPLNAKVICNLPTIIATTKYVNKNKLNALMKKGVGVIKVKAKNKMVNLKALMKILGGRNIQHVLIEGGGSTTASALESGIVDKIYMFIAPKIIGGTTAPTAVEGTGIKKLSNAWNLRNINCKKIGKDLLIEGYINDKM